MQKSGFFSQIEQKKPQKNEETLKSLTKLGQEKVGIITEDGIIIDGNRRAMLLNRIPQIDYFKAIILPVEHDGNPLEIEKVETRYQLGEERKLDYNPIEIYLKIQQLYTRISNKKYNRNDIDKEAVKRRYFLYPTDFPLPPYLPTVRRDL